jgi:hypothetical protein
MLPQHQQFVAGAHESGSVEEPRNLSETELLSKMQKGEKNPVVRTGPSHKVDDWFELCERNGKKPTLTGVLGCIHINLEVKTVYRHNRGKLDIQAEVRYVGGTAVLWLSSSSSISHSLTVNCATLATDYACVSPNHLT